MTLCGVLGGRRLQFPCGFMLALYVGTTDCALPFWEHYGLPFYIDIGVFIEMECP